MESAFHWSSLSQLYDIRYMFVNNNFLLQFSLETVILLCFSSQFTKLSVMTLLEYIIQGPVCTPRKALEIQHWKS